MSIERLKFRGMATKGFQIQTEHGNFLRTIEFGAIVTTDDFVGAENSALNEHSDRLVKFFKYTAVGLIDLSTVGKWTGLVDKNGKEIYEGDRLRITSEMEDVTLEQVVKWHPEGGYFAECFDGGDYVPMLGADDYTLEVIGNIHEVKNG